MPFFKVSAPDRAVRISNYQGVPCAMVTNPTYSHIASEIAKATAITEIEFELALNNVISQIKNAAA